MTDCTAMAPVLHRVRSRAQETGDTATLRLAPVHRGLPGPLPGQFMMLYAYGIGEVAISASGWEAHPNGTLTHTVRAVGAVSRALHDLYPGDIVGVRGPFGTTWGLENLRARDLVLVAGGVGLAPLRAAICYALAHRRHYGRIVLIAGARSRTEFLFPDELAEWDSGTHMEVHLTVDVPVQGWRGETGLVTEPLRRLTLDPEHTLCLVCGPEPMMRSSAAILLEKGMPPSAIRVSLERNMQCGVGWCGHCQLGPLLLCRDGPVVGHDVAAPLLSVAQL